MYNSTGVHLGVAQESCVDQTSTTLWSKSKIFDLIIPASWLFKGVVEFSLALSYLALIYKKLKLVEFDRGII